MASSVSVRISLKDADLVKRGLLTLGEDGRKALTKIQSGARPASRGLLAVGRAGDELRGSMTGMAGRLGAVGVGLSALGPAGLAAAAGLALTVGAFVKTIRRTREGLEALDALEDQANKANFGIERLQELRAAADETGAGIRFLDDGVSRLNRRLGLFVQDGGGPAAKAFETLGINVRTAGGAVRSTEAVFDDVVASLEDIEDQALRTALASQLFGEDAGPRLTLLLDQGTEGIARLAKQAREAGEVIDESLVKRGADAADDLARLGRVIDANVTAALVDLAPLLISIGEGFAFVAREVREVFDAFRDLENLGTSGLQTRRSELTADLEAQAEIVDQLQRQREQILAAGGTSGPGTSLAQALQNETAKLEALVGELLEIDSRLGTFKTEPDAGGGGGGTPSETPEQKKIREVIAALELEKEALDFTAKGKRVLTALRRAGITETAAEAAGIRDLVLEIAKEEEAQKAATDAVKERDRLRAEGRKIQIELGGDRAALAERQKELNEIVAAGGLTAEQASKSLEGYADSLDDVGVSMDSVVEGGLKDMASSLARGEVSWRSLADVATRQLSRIINSLIDAIDLSGTFSGGGGGGFLGGIGGLFSGIFNTGTAGPIPGDVGFGGGGGAGPFGFAKGAAFEGGVQRLQRGGVVRRPTLFRAARGAALGGEAGPEGLLPLARTATGDLGVRAVGAGGGIGTVQIFDQRRGGEREERRTKGPDGRDVVRIFIRDEVQKTFNSGDFDQTMGNNFGLGRMPTQRG